MGQAFGRPTSHGSSVSSLDLHQGAVPTEILHRILSFLPAKECIVNSRLVCKQWRDIVDSKSFWKPKCDAEGLTVPLRYHEFIDWRKVYLRRPFGRNFIKNWNAEAGLQDWEILENGGNRMKVETNICPGADELPEELLAAGCSKAWATSYGIARKCQVIDLDAEGVSAELMDKAKPHVYYSEWWAGRFDCGCHYEIKVELLSDEREANGSYKVLHCSTRQGTEDQWQGREWKKVEDTFTSYGEGVRRIRITHAGSDTQFWAGHFGSKFTGTTLKLLLVD